MSILNVNQIQPVGGGNTITVSANDVNFSGNISIGSSFVGTASTANLATSAQGLTGTPDITVGNIQSGVVTATTFIGDGSGLTGVTASGSGINIKDSGSTVGVAATVNFSTNLNVSPASAGIVTVTVGDTDFAIADKIIHTGDTNTAIRFPAADTITAETAGSERLRITSGGDVCVGGHSSNYANSPLEVRGTNAGGDVAIRVTNNSTASGTQAGIIFTTTTADYTTAGIGFERGTDDALKFYVGQSAGGGGFTNATERLRITSDGKVGIGTDNPARGGLHIHKASTAELHLTDDTTGSGSGDGLTIFSAVSSAGVWYRENANLRFATNNTERMIITSGGNVDINGTPPWTVTGGNYRNLSISGSDASSSGFLWLGNGAAATNADFDLGRVNFVNGTNIVAQIKGTTQTSANDDGRISFLTKSTGGNISEKLRITADGDVQARRARSNTAGDVALSIQPSDSTIHYGFRIDSANNNLNLDRVGTGNFVTITSDGKVGINTNTFNDDAEALRVQAPSGQSNTHLTIKAGSTSGYSVLNFGDNDFNEGRIKYDHSSNTMEFFADDTGFMKYEDDNTVGGGRWSLTSTGTFLSGSTVDYYVNAGSTRTYGFYVHKNNTGGTYGIYSYTLGGNSTQYSIGGQVNTTSTYSSGGVLGYSINSNTYGILGYWSTSAYYTLYGNGVSLCTGGHTTSDARLKDVQSGIGTGILDKVCSLEAKKYTWKENTQQRRSVGIGTQIGLLAQDVLEHFPEVVMEHENPEIAGHNPETLNEQIGTTYSIDYGKMTAVLIEAIKDLKAENNALAARVAALEGS